MFTGDPRTVPDAQLLPQLSYEEATALAEAGSKILFPQTMDPAAAKGIIVRVKNSFRPQLAGTTISRLASAGERYDWCEAEHLDRQGIA